MTGRLVVCPTPIGNLEDITLRVLVGAARGGRRRLRGHAPDRRAARALRRAGDARPLPRAQRARADRRPRRAHAGGRRRRAGLRRGHAARLRSRATCSSRAASRRGSRSRCCPARPPRSPRSSPRRCPPTRGASPASCRASAPALVAAFGSPETLVAFESPKRVAASLAVLAELDPAARWRVCRELTKLHEEVVRGRRGDAGRALRGVPSRAARSCSSSAARRRGGTSTSAAVDGGAAAGRGGGQAAGGGGRGGRAHGRAGERALRGGGDGVTLASLRPVVAQASRRGPLTSPRPGCRGPLHRPGLPAADRFIAPA